MKYSDEELLIIYEKRLDLSKKPDPSTDTAVIEFLKKKMIFCPNFQKICHQKNGFLSNKVF